MRIALVVLLFLFLLLSSGIAQTYNFIPLGISYQGRLTGSDGNAVSDGTYAMEFYLYDDSTAGSILWRQPQDGQPAQQVETSDGFFTVVLGTTDYDLFSSVINENPADRWLQVKVSGELLNPRTRLLSEPFSYRSVIADSCRQAVNASYADTSSYSIISEHAVYSDTSLHSTYTVYAESSFYADTAHYVEVIGDVVIDSTVRYYSIPPSSFIPGLYKSGNYYTWVMACYPSNSPKFIRLENPATSANPDYLENTFAPVNLPHNAILTKFILYGVQLGTPNVALFRYRFSSRTSQEAVFSEEYLFGGGGPLDSLVITQFTSNVINNQDYNYSLVIEDLGPHHELYGARIEYIITEPLP